VRLLDAGRLHHWTGAMFVSAPAGVSFPFRAQMLSAFDEGDLTVWLKRFHIDATQQRPPPFCASFLGSGNGCVRLAPQVSAVAILAAIFLASFRLLRAALSAQVFSRQRQVPLGFAFTGVWILNSPPVNTAIVAGPVVFEGGSRAFGTCHSQR